jgi:hypothetical protein
MTPLEAAQRLASDCPIETDRGGRGECHYCGSGNYEGEYLSGSPTLPDVLHTPDCPWLSMPKIIAALEAAGRLVESTQPTQYAIPARVICQICHSEGPDWSHTSTCTWAPAKAALEG